jgi:outer membrane receptor protein involved in Fe transport
MKQLISAIALISLTAPIFAEEPEVQTLPTTVVTGELWESDIQETTASITIFDEAELETNGVQHFEDVINSIPNLTWTGGSSRPRYIQIRGIGENSQYEGETPDSTVRFMIDDLDFTGLGSVGNLFDVQQVEVLRGPQAGAFGANAAGGVIKIVTNEPTPYWTGQTEVTVGNDNHISGGIAVGGPILENDPEQLTFRVSVHQLLQDGFRENKYLDKDDTNEINELTTRLKVRWIANENWQWDGTFFYANADNGFDEFSLNNTEFDTYSNEPGRDEQESLAASLRGTWTGLDKIKVSTITSISATNSTYSYDGDWTNPTYILGSDAFVWLDRERTRWSQEIRFDSIDQEDALSWIDRWTAGIYFEDFSESSTFGGDWGGFQTEYDTETLSAYTQGTHNFSESTRLTIGLRAEYFDLKTDTGETREDANFNDLLLGGKITLEHDLNSNQMLFASLTRGYKAGGPNIYPYLDSSLPTTYETEYLWNYEIGLRSTWFDGAVNSKVTLFYLDRENTQVRGSSGEGIDYSYYTVNGKDAEHYGAEAEATWFINENFTLNLAGGLLETDRDAFVVSGSPTVFYTSGDVSNAPNFTYSARLDYQAKNGIFASAELVGSDEYYESDDPNDRNYSKRSAFALVNASIGYRYENWTFTLWAKNLFDEGYEKRVFYFNNYHPDDAAAITEAENNGTDKPKRRYEDPANPRTFGVTVNYSW